MHASTMALRTLLLVPLVFAPSSKAATLTGTVTYHGEPPAMRTLAMDADPVCAMQHTAPPRAQSFVTGEEGGLANVIVRLTGGVPGGPFPVPDEPAVLDQLGCTFFPHVLVLRAGQALNIRNSDDTLHNVHAYPVANDEFNLAMPKFRKQLVRVFEKVEEEPFRMTCDVHPWMENWIAVLPHPFFAVTDPSGRFVLEGLPAGTYELEAWHERLGIQSAGTTVGDGETAEVHFTFEGPSAPVSTGP